MPLGLEFILTCTIVHIWQCLEGARKKPQARDPRGQSRMKAYTYSEARENFGTEDLVAAVREGRERSRQ